MKTCFPLTIDLLAGVTDADGDSLDVAQLTSTLGDTSGITVSADGNQITIDPSFYNFLGATEFEEIRFAYDVEDGNGGAVARELAIFVSGVNDAPVADTPVTENFDERSGVVTIDLLQNSFDPDLTDSLSVVGLNQTAGNAVAVSVLGNQLFVDTEQFDFLFDGETHDLEFEYPGC